MSNIPNRDFLIGLARATGGAILFALPMLMTMEMWWLGFYMQPVRLGLLIILAVPLLSGLAFYSGFKKQMSLLGAIVDAFVAYAVGFMSAALVLALIAEIDFTSSPEELIGKLSLQAIPGGFGAVLASSQLGLNDEADTLPGTPEDHLSDTASGSSGAYLRELFLMLAGALFLAFNVAPTDEIALISYQMTAWHAIALVVVSLASMHGFVYVVQFRGQESRAKDQSFLSVFLRFTVVGYAIALLVSFYCLWTFGRTDGDAFEQIVTMAVVLAFPGALGAAAARLIL